MPVVPSESRAGTSPGRCPSSAMPRPNMACSRRRQPLFANIVSFVMPWRSNSTRSAARLRPRVGPLASRHTVPNRPGSRRDRASPRITEHIRAYPGISGHIRAYPGVSGRIRASSRNQTSSGKKGSSRAIWSVAGHGVGTGRRGWASRAVSSGDGTRSSGTASGMVVACRTIRRRIACRTIRRPIASRPISARVGDLGVSAVVMVGRSERPSPAMPRPNSRL